jgi:colanic acid/amylovoran biosynthesis glycosyltransferase
MKILFITSSFPYGPSETFLMPEIRELMKTGHEVIIVPAYPRGEVVHDAAAPLLENTVRRPVISLEIMAAASAAFIANPAACLRTVGWMFKSRGLKMTLRNLAVLPKSFWLARLARKVGADHVYAHWAASPATIAMVAGEVAQLPWSFTAHRWDIIENNLLSLKAEKVAFARIISEDGCEMARELGANVSVDKNVLHMGVEIPESITYAARTQGPCVVICPALLVERKGQRYLIRAMEMLRQRSVDVVLWLAGQGEDREELERMVSECKLAERVRFLGQVSHDALLAMFRDGAVDMIALPSLHEGIPASLQEAMGYGIPVIATPVGGIPELLRDGAGLMVPTTDADALADAIERLVDDPQLRLSLGQAGRERVEREFAIRTVTAELVRRLEGSTADLSGNLSGEIDSGESKTPVLVG